MLCSGHSIKHYFIFIPFYLYFLRHNGVNGLAAVIRLYRELTAEAPVNQYTELNFVGAPEIKQGVERGSYCSAFIQHIINQNYILVFYGKRNVCFISGMQFSSYIVAVKSNIQFPVFYLFVCIREFISDIIHYPVTYKYTTGLYADQYNISGIINIFQYLVCQSLYGYIKLFFSKYGPQSVQILSNKSITKNDKNLINAKAPD